MWTGVFPLPLLSGLTVSPKTTRAVCDNLTASNKPPTTYQPFCFGGDSLTCSKKPDSVVLPRKHFAVGLISREREREERQTHEGTGIDAELGENR